MKKHRKISEDDNNFLIDMFDIEEIEPTVWACGNEKAPGPNGFTFALGTISCDSCNTLNFVQDHLYINVDSNASFNILLLKVKDLINLVDFRPVNLVGWVYKIISKLLVERLKKKTIGFVISKEQSAYL